MIYENKVIKDICEFIGGSQPPKSEFIYAEKEGYVRLIQTRDRLSDNFITFIPQNSTTKFCESDDILIGRYGPPIFQIFRGFKGAYNVAIMKANPLNGVNKDYLYYFLLQPAILKYVDSMSSRTGGQTGVELDSLYEYPVKLPSVKYQNRIADVLGAIDAKIQINNKINAELEAMAKTIYDYWFLQFDFPTEESKPYKSTGGKMVWNEELKREIPEGWEVKNLDEAIEILDYKRIPLSTTERGKQKIKKYPYYGAQGVIDYVEDYIFDGTYLLVAEDGNNLKSQNESIITLADGKFWVNNHAHILGKKKIPLSFIHIFLSEIDISGLITGSAQPKLNQKNLCNIKVLCPNDEVLHKFANTVDLLMEKFLHIRKESAELASLRDFLLPMLMNGQVGLKEE